MLENIRFSNPDTLAKPPGYSNVVEVIGPGRTVYFAGQFGIDKSGKMGANAREQMEIAFENVKAALASVGAGQHHNRRATASASRRFIRGRSNRDITAKMTSALSLCSPCPASGVKRT